MIWWTLFAAIASIGIGFAIHMFAQGFWYMACALQNWGKLTAKQARRQRRWSTVVALMVAPAMAIGLFLYAMAVLP